MNKFINFLSQKSLNAKKLLAAEYAYHRTKFSYHMTAKIGHQGIEYMRFALFLSGSIFLGIMLAAIIV